MFLHFAAIVDSQIRLDLGGITDTSSALSRFYSRMVKYKAQLHGAGILSPIVLYQRVNGISKYRYWMFAPDPPHGFSVLAVQAVIDWEVPVGQKSRTPVYSSQLLYKTCLEDWGTCLAGGSYQELRDFSLARAAENSSTMEDFVYSSLAAYGTAKYKQLTGKAPLAIDVVRYLWSFDDLSRIGPARKVVYRSQL